MTSAVRLAPMWDVTQEKNDFRNPMNDIYRIQKSFLFEITSHCAFCLVLKSIQKLPLMAIEAEIVTY